MNLRDLKTPSERREALSKELSVELAAVGSSDLPISPANEKNCENMIGFTQIPLGVAGPLEIKGLKKRSCYVPLATTEGALVASVSRGCKAISLSGGAVVDFQKTGVTRAPVFKTGSIEEKKKFSAWVLENKELLKKVTEETSSHLKLSTVQIKSLPSYTFLRFSFDTQDAMGMNMVTIATEKAVSLIEKETGAECISVSGNYDVDKKPAWINFIENRGTTVWAETVLPKQVVLEVLKTTPEKFFETWLSKCMLGSAMSGSLGFNAHFANVIAAIFLATGQDAAHVVEGSLGMTTARVLSSGDLYVSVYLPSLMSGTVGGGIALPTQKEALEIMGVSGTGKAGEFAEIIGAAVLAGEISLLASLSVGSLGSSHVRLGRGEKV